MNLNVTTCNDPHNVLCLHSGLPANITISSLINGSFTINWTISDPSYNYIVIWTNLNTGVLDSFTAPKNTHNYTVTRLSDNDNYAVSIATVDVCGMMITSDPITICGKNTCYTYVATVCVLTYCNNMVCKSSLELRN